MIPASVANRLWQLACLPNHRRFAKALDAPETTQREWLRSHLNRNASTRFGRRHSFERLRNLSDYQAVVPLSTYAEYNKDIDAIARGARNVLTTDPVTRFVPTSGSTAACKLIPWTAALQRDFSRAIGAWVTDLFHQYPDVRDGPAYWSVSPALPHTSQPQSRIPVGFDDDTRYLGGLAGRLVGGLMAVPSDVRHIADADTFRYLVLLHLLACRDLRLVSVWHPSFLTLLLDWLPEHYERIIHALRHGSLDPPRPLPREVSERLGRGLHPRATRARELKALDPDRAEQLWPRLRLLSAWGDHRSPELTDLTRRFPRASFQPKGLLATEAVVTFPFAGRTPLAITSHFFEFLDEAGNLHLAHELEQDHRYEVVVTTSGGFYRYRLRDRVDVVGFLGRTPCLRFAGRAGRVFDLRGEKLDEAFVRVLLDRLTRTRVDSVLFRLLVADPEGPKYTLFLGTHSLPDLAALSADLDRQLMANPNYQACRFLGQLQPARAVAVSARAIDAYFEWNQARGRLQGGIKPAVIDSGPDLATCLLRHALRPQTPSS